MLCCWLLTGLVLGAVTPSAGEGSAGPREVRLVVDSPNPTPVANGYQLFHGWNPSWGSLPALGSSDLYMTRASTNP